MIAVRARFFVLVAISILATIPTPAHSAENPLAKGQWAFEFAAEAFSANAASFIVRRHFSKRSALQLDAFVEVLSADRLEDGIDVSPPDTIDISRGETTHSHQVQLGASYVFYPKAEGKALLFLSAGGFYSRGKSKDEFASLMVGPSTIQSISNFESRTWGVGATGKIGFDWFFSSRLSLGSRYGVSLGYTHRDADELNRIVNGTNVIDRTRHGLDKFVNFDMTQLQIGISFYP